MSDCCSIVDIFQLLHLRCQSLHGDRSEIVMASLFSLLAAFPFETPDIWPKWQHRFEHCVASGFQKKSPSQHIALLFR